MINRKFNQKLKRTKVSENPWSRRKEQFNAKFKNQNYNYGQGY